MGQELAGACTPRCLAHVPDALCALTTCPALPCPGVLIGVGSFGRVYRGTFRGRDVAVKKILHSQAEAPKIEREIK